MTFQNKSGIIFNDITKIQDEITKKLRERYIHNPNVKYTPSDLTFLESEITMDDNVQLCKPITTLEIKNSVFDLSNDKSPGPDGYPTYFSNTTSTSSATQFV